MAGFSPSGRAARSCARAYSTLCRARLERPESAVGGDALPPGSVKNTLQAITGCESPSYTTLGFYTTDGPFCKTPRRKSRPLRSRIDGRASKSRGFPRCPGGADGCLLQAPQSGNYRNRTRRRSLRLEADLSSSWGTHTDRQRHPGRKAQLPTRPRLRESPGNRVRTEVLQT